MKKDSPADILKQASELFEKKNSEDNYKGSYEKYGDVMMGLFPEGLTIKSRNDWIAFGIFTMIISKILRLSAVIFGKDREKSVEKREDNSLDLTVYGSMLTSVLKMIRRNDESK